MSLFLRALALAVLLALPAAAQQTGIQLGGLKQDPNQPVEVTAENLAVDNAKGTAVFTGNVLVKQGEMRMSAGRIEVDYAPDGKGVSQLRAYDGVTLVSPTDAAEAREAVYTIATGRVLMTGSVLLTQGTAAISGDKLDVDLKTGAGTMSGQVKTVFTPGQGGGKPAP
jgi:lipopolysaccharide export system protein LptA